jgi:hypothetical protein
MIRISRGRYGLPKPWVDPRRPASQKHPVRLFPVLVVFLASCSATPPRADPAADAPAPRSAPAENYKAASSYAEALAMWRKPEDINAFIGARFEYDSGRAIRLSESQRTAGQAPAIHEPSAFYDRSVGVCVDLARFAVESLRTIAPELQPRYLMVEFSPTLHKGQVLRRHWITSFERDGHHYFFADSKYPGTIRGPYASVEAFVVEYQTLRQREVVAFRQLDSYRRQSKVMQQRAAGVGDWQSSRALAKQTLGPSPTSTAIAMQAYNPGRDGTGERHD